MARSAAAAPDPRADRRDPERGTVDRARGLIAGVGRGDVRARPARLAARGRILLWAAVARWFAPSWPRACWPISAVRRAGGGRRLRSLIVGYAAARGRRRRPAVDRSRRQRPRPPRAYDAAARARRSLYLQPQLLERELAALLPRREGSPNLYLVSVAGYAEQDVFMREVERRSTRCSPSASARAAARSASSTTAATVRDTPLATRTSLGGSAEARRCLMNRDEDVLFLFLTSHGSPDGKFSLEFPPLQPARPVTPRTCAGCWTMRASATVWSWCRPATRAASWRRCATTTRW